ncbi:LysR family transcriptional regulator [Pandoraea commovens]|uniref:HTH-type transcriptional regulator PgrR n=1 Tax=Pandoraea commovens TaxID=2508289 RepID=A0A5E4SR67_9BURK|nr:LysR family transcriptional regulator [Pandoraea commovens]VVD77611.1 HTH-type transcriptional regulator PgrR [Pandoraea commovens]
MDKLQAMLVFTKVVETKSFAGAADSLSMNRSSVTTMIQQLEAYLKVGLLNRTTRRISVTPDGASYYERCVRVLAEIEETESSFSAISIPRGRLTVDVPGTLGRLLLVPALDEFHRRYPDIDLMLGVGDRHVDLVQDSIDCAIRIGQLQDSTLVARRIGAAAFVTVASPGYLKAYGTPSTVDDLGRHVAVNYFSNGRILQMDFLVDGQAIETRLPSHLAANDGDAYLQCGLRGLGLIQVPRFLAQSHIDAGDLVEVLPAFRPVPLPVSVVYPQNRHLSPKVRAFAEWVTELANKCPLLSSDNIHPSELAPSKAKRVTSIMRRSAVPDSNGVNDPDDELPELRNDGSHSVRFGNSELSYRE